MNHGIIRSMGFLSQEELAEKLEYARAQGRAEVLSLPRTTGAVKPGDWMENAQNLANIGHALAGYAVLVTAMVFTKNMWIILGIELALALYVGIKEFWYDLRYETGETVRSSSIDAFGYLIGNAVASLLLVLRYLV